MGCVIVITSGKGGTGKTSLTGGLGTALALQGHKVLCIDGDVGLRNLDITLGMTDAALWTSAMSSPAGVPWAGRWRPIPLFPGCISSPRP